MKTRTNYLTLTSNDIAAITSFDKVKKAYDANSAEAIKYIGIMSDHQQLISDSEVDRTRVYDLLIQECNSETRSVVNIDDLAAQLTELNNQVTTLLEDRYNDKVDFDSVLSRMESLKSRIIELL